MLAVGACRWHRLRGSGRRCCPLPTDGVSIHLVLPRTGSASLQIDEESQTDGNYTSALTVVTVEPAGLSSSHENKARLLLVR